MTQSFKTASAWNIHWYIYQHQHIAGGMVRKSWDQTSGCWDITVHSSLCGRPKYGDDKKNGEGEVRSVTTSTISSPLSASDESELYSGWSDSTSETSSPSLHSVKMASHVQSLQCFYQIPKKTHTSNHGCINHLSNNTINNHVKMWDQKLHDL